METLFVVVEEVRIDELVIFGGNLLCCSGGLQSFDTCSCARCSVVNIEVVLVRAGDEVVSIATGVTLKLVKNTVVFVQVTQLRAEIIVDVNGLKGLTVHL